jgi:hypothetical protein
MEASIGSWSFQAARGDGIIHRANANSCWTTIHFAAGVIVNRLVYACSRVKIQRVRANAHRMHFPHNWKIAVFSGKNLIVHPAQSKL